MRKATCPALPISKNLTVTGSSSAVGSVVKFNCAGPGNILEGPSVLQCSINGKWNGSVPTCLYVPDIHFNITTSPAPTPLIENIAQVENTQQHVVIWVIGGVVLVVLIFFIFCLVKKRLKRQLFSHLRLELQELEADNPSFINNDDAWMWIAEVAGDGPSRASRVRSSMRRTSTDQINDETFLNIRLPTYSEAVDMAIESQRAIFATGASIPNPETSSYQRNETGEVTRLRTIMEISHILKHAMHSSKPPDYNEETLSAVVSSLHDEGCISSNVAEVSDGTTRSYETQDAHETVDHLGSHVELSVELQRAIYTTGDNIPNSESILFQPDEAADVARPKTVEEITQILKHATHSLKPPDYDDESLPENLSHFHHEEFDLSNITEVNDRTGHNYYETQDAHEQVDHVRSHVELSEPSDLSFDEVNHVKPFVEIAQPPDPLLLKQVGIGIENSQSSAHLLLDQISTTVDISQTQDSSLQNHKITSVDYSQDSLLHNQICMTVDISQPDQHCDSVNATTQPPMELSKSLNSVADVFNAIRNSVDLCQPPNNFCVVANASIGLSKPSDIFSERINPLDTSGLLSQLSFCHRNNPISASVDPSQPSHHFCDVVSPTNIPLGFPQKSDPFCDTVSPSSTPVDLSTATIASNTFCDMKNAIDISESSNRLNADDGINKFQQSRTKVRSYSWVSGENDAFPMLKRNSRELSEHNALQMYHSNSRRSSDDNAIHINSGNSTGSSFIPATAPKISSVPQYQRSVPVPGSSNKLVNVGNGFKKALGALPTPWPKNIK